MDEIISADKAFDLSIQSQRKIAEDLIKEKISKAIEVDETSEAFGSAVQYFKTYLEEPLKEIIAQNRGKHQLFNGVKEIDFSLNGMVQILLPDFIKREMR